MQKTLSNLTFYFILCFSGLSILSYAQASNDICSTAIPLTVNINKTCVPTIGTTIGATDSAELPATCTSYLGGDVWFTVTVPVTGNVTVETFEDLGGFMFNTDMAIYSGSCGALTEIVCDQTLSGSFQYSTIKLSGLNPGDVLFVRVWEAGNLLRTNTFGICAYDPEATNDMCVDAIALPVNLDQDCGVITHGTIEAATDSSLDTPPEDTTSCPGTPDDDVWFSFVATNGNHQVKLDNIQGNPTDLHYSVWEGSCGSLTKIICSLTNITYTLTGLTAGTTYYIRVYSFNTVVGQDTEFDICVGTLPPPPINDECANAIPFPGDVLNGICVTNFDFTAYTDSENPGPSCHIERSTATAWFSWTAPVISAVGDPVNLFFSNGTQSTNDCDIGIEVYETDCLTTASNCVFGNSNYSPVTGLFQGTDYMLMIYDANSLVKPAEANCDFCLILSCNNPTFTAEAVCEVGNEDEFFVDVDVTDFGGGNTAFELYVNGPPSVTITTTGVTTHGPFPNGSQVFVDLFGTDDSSCSVNAMVDNGNCVCDPLAVEAVADSTICPNELFTLDVSLDVVIPGGFIYEVSTLTPGSCTAVPDNPADCVDLALSNNVASAPIPLGFSFDFFETSYTDICVGDNGFISFTCIDAGNPGEQPIPSMNNPNGIVALFWDYLDPTRSNSGTICTYASTINGQTCFVVDYQDIFHWGLFSSVRSVTGQIIICPDNTITINCIDCQSDFQTAVQGIENETGEIGYFDPAFPKGVIPSASSTSNCVSFTPTTIPASACQFVAWVTDVNDIAGSTVSTTTPFDVSPSVTTTYYAVVDCDGVLCRDEVVVTVDDQANCCVLDLTLSGTVNNAAISDFTAQQSISSDQLLSTGTQTTYSAGNNINLLPTFEVELGALFLADLPGCSQ